MEVDLREEHAGASVTVDAYESPVRGCPDVVLLILFDGEHAVALEAVIFGGVVNDVETVALLDDMAQSQRVTAQPNAVGHGERLAVGPLRVTPAGEVDEASAAQIEAGMGIGRCAQPQSVVSAVEIEFADMLRQ